MSRPDFFLNMPKVELHAHIEGSVSSHTYYQLSEKNQVKLPCSSLEEWESYFEFKDFAHFIQVYTTAVSTIQQPEDLSQVIEDFYRGQKAQHIVYSEAYLSATFLVEKFGIEEILEAVAQGRKQGEAKYGVKVNIIPDIARHLPDSQDEVLKLVQAGFEREIFIGLGLGGLEMNFPPQLFTETYRRAREMGMRVVAHAGEGVGPESIWGAIEALKAERIGHGIRCVDDPRLMDYLRDTQIPIEVSPTSNYHLGVVAADQPHPIRRMVDYGLNCSVNSDDSSMFSTTLSKEYERLVEQGFSVEELIQLNRNAIQASFLSATEKREIESRLDAYLNQASI